MSGLEDGSSDVTVRCANNGIWVEACPVTIRNCDVEVTGLYDRETASAGTCGRYGIYKPGSSSLTIAGHAKNGNTLTVKSTDDVISCPGSVTHISNCDVDMLLGGSDTETLTTEAGGEAYYKLTYDNANTTFGWYWGPRTASRSPRLPTRHGSPCPPALKPASSSCPAMRLLALSGRRRPASRPGTPWTA